MTITKHTPEPWAKDPLYGFVIDKNGEPVDLFIENEIGNNNMDRLVACVNACAGMGTEFLENVTPHQTKVLIGFASENERLVLQRDELLQALKAIAFATASEPDDGSYHENAYLLATQAIEKHEVIK